MAAIVIAPLGYCDSGANTGNTNECLPKGGVGQVGDPCSHDTQCMTGVCKGLGRDAAGGTVPGLAPMRSRSTVNVRPIPNAHRGIVMLEMAHPKRINACHAAVPAAPATGARIAINVALENATDSRKMISANGLWATALQAPALWQPLAAITQSALQITATPGMAHPRPINVCPEGERGIPTTRAVTTTSASINHVTD